MGVKKSSKKSSSKKSSVGAKLKKVVKGAVGGKTTGTRRHHGVTWYQNAVLKEKLKKRLQRLKYGGR